MPKAWVVLNLKSHHFGLFLCLILIIFTIMLKSILIGNLGADAEVKVSNGHEFVTFRVAHSWNFTATDGTTNSGTIWVDCIGSRLNEVVKYLKKGTQVYVEGTVSLRVYSSKVDRCMKAGLTINVESLQLIGGKPDIVPKQLINPADGTIHEVSKVYVIADMIGAVNEGQRAEMIDNAQNVYVLTQNGFVYPDKTENKGQ